MEGRISLDQIRNAPRKPNIVRAHYEDGYGSVFVDGGIQYGCLENYELAKAIAQAITETGYTEWSSIEGRVNEIMKP